MKQILITVLSCMLLSGCAENIGPAPTVDTAAPFTATALISVGDRRHKARLDYGPDTSLVLELDTDTLRKPMRQVADSGGTTVELGQQQFTYPADWISTANMAQLIRGALVSPQTTEKNGSVLLSEGTTQSVPFIIESNAEGKVLLSLTFPTLDVQIELSDFQRDT